jgi:hypothetical protein
MMLSRFAGAGLGCLPGRLSLDSQQSNRYIYPFWLKQESLMGNHFAEFDPHRFVPRLAPRRGLMLAVALITAFPLLGAAQSFTVPDDIALRIRLDDTLTSVDSEVGDPFSATVVDRGDYQDARVHGHIANIDMSGRVDGHTSMLLRFDRLVMPDGRRARIRAEIIELYHAPSGEKIDVEGAVESSGRRRTAIEHTILGAGAGALLGGIFGGGKGAGIGSIVGGAGGLGTTAFYGHQKITLNSGLEMLIRIIGR